MTSQPPMPPDDECPKASVYIQTHGQNDKDRTAIGLALFDLHLRLLPASMPQEEKARTQGHFRRYQTLAKVIAWFVIFSNAAMLFSTLVLIALGFNLLLHASPRPDQILLIVTVQAALAFLFPYFRRIEIPRITGVHYSFLCWCISDNLDSLTRNEELQDIWPKVKLLLKPVSLATNETCEPLTTELNLI